MKKLPITIQSFKKISTDTFIYIDKTEHIYNLTKDIVPLPSEKIW